jgi:hypothetical protein
LLWVQPASAPADGAAVEASLDELAALGREKNLTVIHNIGSGGILDLSKYGLRSATARESIQAGADLVLMSGDKLLGGPQCGIILGKRELISRIALHPLARALQADKLTLAALAGTLRLCRAPETAARRIPLVQLLDTSLDNLKNRAQRLLPQVAACEGVTHVEAVQGLARLNEGRSQAETFPTWRLEITHAEGAGRLAAMLRQATPPVIGSVEQGRLVIDLRTVFPRQDQLIASAFHSINIRRRRQAEPVSVASTNDDGTLPAASAGRVKHTVLLRFKPETPQETVDGIFRDLAGLTSRSPGAINFSGGPYSSSEGLHRGFTHGFVMTFENEAARDAYLIDPEHEAIKARILPELAGGVDGVAAFDWLEP